MRRTRFTALLPCIALTALAVPARAQNAGGDEAAVAAVITRVFDGMRTRDTTLMRSLFHPQATMAEARRVDGQVRVNLVPVDGWLQGVAAAPDTLRIDERTWNPVVHVDANIAMVWVPYALYLNDRFSHCGYDAFTLVRSGSAWLITNVSDTRRREGCPPGMPH